MKRKTYGQKQLVLNIMKKQTFSKNGLTAYLPPAIYTFIEVNYFLKLSFRSFQPLNLSLSLKKKGRSLFRQKDDSLLKGHLAYNWVSLRRFNIVLTSLVNIRSGNCFRRGLKRT